MMKKLNFFVVALGLLFVESTYASSNLYNTNALQLVIQQPQANWLKCDYRLLKMIPINYIEAKIGKIVLPVLTNNPFPETTSQSAIFFLVDISDPRRKQIIKKNIKQIKQIIEQARSYHQFGLASFSTELQVLAPLGTAPADIATQAKQLRAGGQTTELYRHTLAAIRLLADYPAQRKALFLFSDGNAEDSIQAYSLNDVLQAAHTANVTIYGLGYIKSINQSVHLQVLRRLSTETGGMFVQANQTFALPEDFLQSPFQALDSGGLVTFDLTPALQAGFNGNQAVHLTWQTETEPLKAKIAVTLNAPSATSNKIWLFSILILVIALLLLLIIWLKRNKSTEPKTIYAFLEFINSEQENYSITTEATRIGRHKNNELQIGNTSVSSHHAEIHRQRDDSFVVTDLGSLNAVYVNGKTEKTITLADGDLIELGEIQLRFVTTVDF